jgi:hypothetical protein
MVLGSMGFTKSDQTGLWKNQLSAQASIRNDDLRCTPSGRIERVYDPLEGVHREYRGILTRAQHTKTLPRHWACSRLEITEQGDGWLEATVGLLAMAHGDEFATDDHSEEWPCLRDTVGRSLHQTGRAIRVTSADLCSSLARPSVQKIPESSRHRK